MKAFTMIELIFVIVILGILATVALPRLAATRDDAEISKAANNLAIFITDLSSYYTSKGNFSSDIGQMTNVQVVNNEAQALNGSESSIGELYLQVKKALCFKMELGTRDGDSFQASTSSEISNNELTNADSIKVTAVSLGKGDKICKEIFNLPATKSIMTASNISVENGTTKVFTVGGTGVIYEITDLDLE